MKLTLIALIVLLFSANTFAQIDEIKRLEDQERTAFLQADLGALNQLWDKDFTVNNPANIIVNRQQVEGYLKSNQIKYEFFERVVEEVLLRGDMAIAMGYERIKSLVGPEAGQTINRRYTDVWARQKGSWRMMARHASIICSPEK